MIILKSRDQLFFMIINPFRAMLNELPLCVAFRAKDLALIGHWRDILRFKSRWWTVMGEGRKIKKTAKNQYPHRVIIYQKHRVIPIELVKLPSRRQMA